VGLQVEIELLSTREKKENIRPLSKGRLYSGLAEYDAVESGTNMPKDYSASTFRVQSNLAHKATKP
jgi:hypothetical protein